MPVTPTHPLPQPAPTKIRLLRAHPRRGPTAWPTSHLHGTLGLPADVWRWRPTATPRALAGVGSRTVGVLGWRPGPTKFLSTAESTARDGAPQPPHLRCAGGHCRRPISATRLPAHNRRRVVASRATRGAAREEDNQHLLSTHRTPDDPISSTGLSELPELIRRTARPIRDPAHARAPRWHAAAAPRMKASSEI